MTRTEKLAVQLLRPINPAIIVVLGFYTIIWGLWILCPFWTVFDHAPLYATMAGIGSEYVWGGLAVIAGCFVTRGAFHPSRRNLQIGAFVGSIHWFIIALLYFLGDWASTGGISALAFAIYSGLVWVNIKVNPEHYPDSVHKSRV